jgi:hypothetical protein
LLDWLSGHRSAVAISIALLVGAGVVAAVLVPLFATSGQVSAELAGTLPTQGFAGQPLEVDVSYDNTGTSVIAPVCVGVVIEGALQPQSAVFQAIDHETFHNGEACGGALGAGQTISIRMMLVPSGTGPVQYRFTPKQGTRTIGPDLSGTLAVAAP